jgi:hypothetical protein
VEQLRLVLAELQVATLKHAVHVGGSEFIAMYLQGKTFAEFPYLDDTVKPMLDDLIWWTNTLKAGRERAKAA